MSGESNKNNVFETPESRRSAIKRVGIGAAALWVAPTVLSRTTAFAAASAPTAPTNLALAGFASQSSTFSVFGASRGNDGNTDCDFTNGSIFHTTNAAHAWWEVNLGAVHALSSIEVFNRCDCCADRAQNLSVTVDGTPVGTIPGTVGLWVTASMPLNVSGQIVRVTNNSITSQPLHLAEVRVFGL